MALPSTLYLPCQEIAFSCDMFLIWNSSSTVFIIPLTFCKITRALYSFFKKVPKLMRMLWIILYLNNIALLLFFFLSKLYWNIKVVHKLHVQPGEFSQNGHTFIFGTLNKKQLQKSLSLNPSYSFLVTIPIDDNFTCFWTLINEITELCIVWGLAF